MSEKDHTENISEHEASQLKKMLNDTGEPSRIVHASRSFEDLSLFLKRKEGSEDEDLYDQYSPLETCQKRESKKMINQDGLAEDFPIENGVIYNSDDNKDTLEYSSGSKISGEIPAATFFIEDSIKSESESSKCKSSEKSKDRELQNEEDDDDDDNDNDEEEVANPHEIQIERKPQNPRESTHIIPFLQQKLKDEQIEVRLTPNSIRQECEKNGTLANVRDYLRKRKSFQKAGSNNQVMGKKQSVGEEDQWKIFAKMRKVRKFCKYLLELKFYSNPNNLQNLHIEAINDSSHFINFKQRFGDYLVHLPVIEPHSLLELIWDILMFLVLLQQFLIIPFEICFDANLIDTTRLKILNYVLPAIILIFDSLIHFNIAYYDKGNLITDHLAIVRNYLRTHFLMNILTTSTFVLQNSIQYSQLFLLFRIPQMSFLLGKIDEHFQLQQRFNTIFELSKLLMLIFGCAHFVACGFHFVATLVEGIDSVTWIQKFNFEDETKIMRYLQSIYFSIITMVTVGYGDITPVSWQEKIYVIIVIIFSCGMFGYSMNTIGAIFQEIAKREAAFKQIKYDMGQYMRSRDIPKYLQTKVLKNLEYSNILNGDQVQKGEAIMNTLTLTLRNQIKREFYGRILSMYKLFNLNFSQEIRQEICLHMKEIILQPGEILYDKGQTNDRIYFLHKGSVEMIQLNQTKQNSTVIGLAPSGSMLGQLGFFTSLPEIIQARCADTCYLLYCDRNNFLQALSKYKYDSEVFCKLRDNLLVYNRQFDTTCFSCYKIGHETSKCNFYNNKILNYICIARYLKSFPQKRDNHVKRTDFRQGNTLKNRWDIMVQARKIRLNYFYQAYDAELSKINASDEELELDTSDMDFLLYIPKIKYYEEEYLYSEGEISNFSDSMYEQEKKENARFSKQISDTHLDQQGQGSKSMKSLVTRFRSVFGKEDLTCERDPELDSSQNSFMRKKTLSQKNFPQLSYLQKQQHSSSPSNSSLSNKYEKKMHGDSPLIGSLSLAQFHWGNAKKESPFLTPSRQQQTVYPEWQMIHKEESMLLNEKKENSGTPNANGKLSMPSQFPSSFLNLENDCSVGEIKTDELIPLPQPHSIEPKLTQKSSFQQLQHQAIHSDQLPPLRHGQFSKQSVKITAGDNKNHFTSQNTNKTQYYRGKESHSRFSGSSLPQSSSEIKDEGKRITSEIGAMEGSYQKISRPSILIAMAYDELPKRSSLKNQDKNSSMVKFEDQNQFDQKLQGSKDEQSNLKKRRSTTDENRIKGTPAVISQFSPMEHFMCIQNFDCQKEYKGYYPNNNISRVLQAWKLKFMKLNYRKSRRQKTGFLDQKRSNKKNCSIMIKQKDKKDIDHLIS